MKTNLSIAHDPTYWAFHSWRQFAQMKDRGRRVVIIPITTFSDWGADIALDFEEAFTLSLLRATLAGIDTPERFLVLPPLRFNLRGHSECFFALDPETAHATLAEVVQSVARHGFRKVLFLNSNPVNADLVDCAGRDLRLSLGIQPFCINLESIGLEWQTKEGRDHCCSLGKALADGHAAEPSVAPVLRNLAALFDEVAVFRELPNQGKVPCKHTFQ